MACHNVEKTSEMLHRRKELGGGGREGDGKEAGATPTSSAEVNWSEGPIILGWLEMNTNRETQERQEKAQAAEPSGRQILHVMLATPTILSVWLVPFIMWF